MMIQNLESQNPELLHVNREAARSYYIPFADEASALEGIKARSPDYRIFSV